MKHSNTSPAVAQVETIDRAKKIDSDDYIIGSHIYGEDKKHYISNGKFKIRASSGASLLLTEIDPSTRAIHFTNSGMNDSEGTPIFASLSSDGNGGDSIKIEDSIFVAKLHLLIPSLEDKFGERRAILVWNKYSKVTGIHTVKEES